MKRTTLIPQLPSSLFAGLCLTLALSTGALAQQAATPTPSDDADTATPIFDATHATVAQATDQAWSMLNNAASDPKHPDRRIEALAAFGTMSTNPRAARMIASAAKDPDVDVRTAAALAAGQTKNRSLTTTLRSMLDDKEPQVDFAAAITLAKLGDRSGEDILMAVVAGDRKATPGMLNGTLHTVNKDFHNPASIAKLGALQGASLLLGPFGFGITAYEYLRKNGADISRITALQELSKLKTNPIHQQLLSALTDKDPGVRAAAATALGEYHDKPTATALLNIFDDPKVPVRLTAAAAYIRTTSASSPRKTSPTP